ncbi:hypothetical protein DNHGIG_25410 [Collibacillus ludicampi]|uniref:SpoVR protein-like N-terminal domain-containing protein n=1 Tax=Collibacillus ludicampi TaxID=2771369 RepID=A0AAV4LHU0_9BACL|nr:SpoVR family protein [Collibacillus ludicampi]GIM46992.1 hypothetical protein DNHGIG_25410 [Collibacillus ludicampi]
MTKEEIKILEKSIEQMMEIARSFGLDFYDMRFEICPADIIYTFGAYGMPTRFSHWSFGKTNNLSNEKNQTFQKISGSRSG